MTARCAALFIVLALCSRADTLILRNGTRVAGQWWSTDAKTVSFLVNDHLEFFPRTDVTEVVFGDAPAGTAAPAPAAPGPASAPAAPASPRSPESAPKKN